MFVINLKTHSPFFLSYFKGIISTVDGGTCPPNHYSFNVIHLKCLLQCPLTVQSPNSRWEKL